MPFTILQCVNKDIIIIIIYYYMMKYGQGIICIQTVP